MSTALACPPRVRLVPANSIDTNVVEALSEIAIGSVQHGMSDCDIVNVLLSLGFNRKQINAVWSTLKNAITTDRADAFGVLTGGVV